MIYYLILISFSFSACQSVKDGFTGSKKSNSDEFLVEKKNPLVLPADFDTLPEPKTLIVNSASKEEEIDLKTILTKKNVFESENLENTTSITEIDSADNVIYKKLIEQKQREELIENYGIFYNSVNGDEKEYTLENNKIKVSFTSKGARISNAEMVELDNNGLFKYRTYNSFINDENKPLSLFEKESSQMSLTIVDAEKVVPVETKDLFFNLVTQNDSVLVFRANAGSTDKYLEFSYHLSKNKYDVDFNIDYHNIENDIKSSHHLLVAKIILLIIYLF